MYDELLIDKEEAIWLSLPRIINHILLLLVGQYWQVINELTFILALWHAKGELEFKVRQQTVSEVKPLYKKQVLDWLVSIDIELQL